MQVIGVAAWATRQTAAELPDCWPGQPEAGRGVAAWSTRQTEAELPDCLPGLTMRLPPLPTLRLPPLLCLVQGWAFSLLLSCAGLSGIGILKMILQQAGYFFI